LAPAGQYSSIYGQPPNRPGPPPYTLASGRFSFSPTSLISSLMPKSEQNPTDPRPDQASTGGQTTSQGTDRDQNTSGNPEAGTAADGAIPTSTQENMGDGAGIRGDYGDASQTNGLEGGPNTPDHPLTDTELTGS
jgi:hypothetical protein